MAEPPVLSHRPQTQTATRQVTTASYSYQGTLPPPEMLERFNTIIPDGANRIVAMAESQQKHRQSLERAVVNGNVAAQSRGQWFGFILGLAAILGGIFLIALGKSALGLTSIIAAVTALAAVFFFGRYEQAQERKRKREEAIEAAKQPRLTGLDD